MDSKPTIDKPISSTSNGLLDACPDVVYCCKCKYYYTFEGYMIVVEECKFNVKRKHDHCSCWEAYDNPNVKNKNNDCQDFELKWWRKLLRRF